jgi:hypothetical protein
MTTKYQYLVLLPCYHAPFQDRDSDGRRGPGMSLNGEKYFLEAYRTNRMLKITTQ